MTSNDGLKAVGFALLAALVVGLAGGASPYLPSTPTITIRKKPPAPGGATTNAWAWYVQTGSGPAKEQFADPAVSVFPDCELRADFIGSSMPTFEVALENAVLPHARSVVLDNGKVAVTITRTPQGTVNWDVRDRISGSSCPRLRPAASVHAIPKEFSGFQVADCTAGSADPCRSVTIQVEVP